MWAAEGLSCRAEGERDPLGWLSPPSQPVPEPGRDVSLQSSRSGPGSGFQLGLGRLLREISFQTDVLSPIFRLGEGTQIPASHPGALNFAVMQRLSNFSAAPFSSLLFPQDVGVRTSVMGRGLEQLSRARESSAPLRRGSAPSTEGSWGAGCRANSSPDPLLGVHGEPGSVVRACPAE